MLPVFPFGEAVGGHGVPDGVIPELFPVVLPGVLLPAPLEPGVVLELDGLLVVPGKGPQGPFVGDAPGVLGVVVDGCVVLPGVVGVVVLGVVVFGIVLGVVLGVVVVLEPGV